MEKSEKFFVSKETAYYHAVTRTLLGILTKTPKLENWKGAIVNPAPIEIYDINGQLLFYEFSVKKGKKTIGRMKVSASQVLGPAVYTIEIGPRVWNLDKAKSEAKRIVEAKFKEAKIELMRVVCYSYPKLGILIVVREPQTKEQKLVIMDIASYETIPILKDSWSIYANIPEKEKEDRILRWQECNRLMETFKEQVKQLGFEFRANLSASELKKLEKVLKPSNPNPVYFLTTKDILQLISPECKDITLELKGQEHKWWCACASGQMILKYYHFNYSQLYIAMFMATRPPNTYAWYNGTLPEGIIAGMEWLSRYYLKAIQDDTPNYYQAQREILRDRPLISCILGPGGGHARVCAGFWEMGCLLEITGPCVEEHKHNLLYIYDPWPLKTNDSMGGATYYEDFDATENLRGRKINTMFFYLRPPPSIAVAFPNAIKQAIPPI